MHSTNSAAYADPVTILFRWLGIILLAVLLGGSGLSLIGTILLVLMAVWNLILSVVFQFNRRLPYQEIFSIVLDFVFAGLFLWGTQYHGLPFVWPGLVTILTGAFYYLLRGGLATAGAVILLDVIFVSISLGIGTGINALAFPAVIMGFTGVVVGMLSQQWGYYIKQKQAMEQVRQEEAERRERERIKALYKITSTMTATLNYQKVLDMAMDLPAKVLSDRDMDNQIVSAALLFFGEQLHVGSARRFTSMDHRVILPAQEGVLYESIRSGQPRKLVNPKEDPELNKLVAIRNCGVVYCYPLRTAQEFFGALIFGHPDPEFFNDLRVEILEIIGRQAFVALQNAMLYSTLEDEKERMMEIQEEARKQLARDLHDGPTQSVAAIAMRVNFARRLLERDISAAGDELFKVEDLARRTTKEIRLMLFTLRPLVLETGGLVEAFISMAEKTKDTYSQTVVIEAEDEAVKDLEAGKQGLVFYIAEEAVNNARKHAEAEKIWVRLLKIQQDIILLEIEDNGVGFNVGELDHGYEKRGSLGMVNMRERTELINGVIQLASEVGKGTRIRVWIPLTDEAAEKIKRGKI
ncbi:GAF domain-containing protein [bacterium]|nr:GAF domain-containing protein [bacterium]